MGLRYRFSRVLIALLLCAQICVSPVSAEVLRLPSALGIIDEEAFSGAEAIDKVVVPQGITEIRSRAFAGSGLSEINLPDSLTYLAEDAFEGCGELLIEAGEGKWTQWALDHGYAVKPAPSPESDFQYRVSEGEAIITAYVGKGGKVVIPETLGGCPVVRIGDSSFSHNGMLEGEETGAGALEIESVYIPRGVEAIGESAFAYCGKLAEIEIPDTVNSIGKYAFQDCGIALIDLPKGLALADGVFRGCEKLVCIDLEGVKSIGRESFSGCAALAWIAIPDGIASIGETAFAGCTALAEISIGDGVESIAMGAFADCYALAEVRFGAGLRSIGEAAFDSCESLTEIVLPDGLESIGDYAFVRCANLRRAFVPEGVTQLGEGAFEGCADGFTICGKAGSAAEEYAAEYGFAFEEAENENNINTFYYSVENGEVTIDHYYELDGSVVIPAEIDGHPVTAIGERCFSGNDRITSVKLPEGLLSIGPSAFASCKNLKTINLPGSLREICSYAFNGCTALEELEFPKTMERIGEGAFAVSGITHAEIPAGITSIAKYLFHDCAALESVVTPETVTSIDKYAFFDCDSLKRVSLAPGLITINEYAFALCDSLETIVLPRDARTVLKNAFSVCGSLKKIVLPESVSIINVEAFANCHPDLTIHGVLGSEAEIFAIEQGISFAAMNAGAAFEGRVLCGENGVPGVKIIIRDTNTNREYPAVYTDADGRWRADGLTLGNKYLVDFVSDAYRIVPGYLYATADAELTAIRDGAASINTTAEGTATIAAACDVQSVETGVPAEFTLTTENANMIRLIVDGVIYESYACGESGGVVRRAFSQSGVREVLFQAGYDNVWGGMSEAMTIEVVSGKGELQNPVVKTDTYCRIAENVCAEWEAVANAVAYDVYLYREGIELYHLLTQECSAEIPGSFIALPGSYSVVVMATAAGYTQSEGAAVFTAVDRNLEIDAEKTVFNVGESCEIAVSAPGADWIRHLIYAPGAAEASEGMSYDNAGTLRFAMDAEGEYRLEIEAGRYGSDEGFVQQEISVYAYRALEIKPESWTPAGAGDAAAIRIYADGEWSIAGVSEGLSARKASADVLYVTVADENFIGKAGSVRIACGGTVKSLFVEAPASGMTDMITAPADGAWVSGDLCVKWREVQGASAYVLTLRNETERKMLLVESFEDCPASGKLIPGALMRNGHSYSLSINAEGTDDADSAGFAVRMDAPAKLTGRIVDINGDPLEKAQVSVLWNESLVADAETGEDGSWSCEGLASGYDYDVEISIGEHGVGSAQIAALAGENALPDIVCPINAQEIEIIDIEYEACTFVHILDREDAVSVDVEGEWLAGALVDVDGCPELQLTADAYIPQAEETIAVRSNASQRTGNVRVGYGDGSVRNYAVRQSAYSDAGTDYLSGVSANAASKELFRKTPLGKHYSIADGTIQSATTLDGNARIEAEHTLNISGANGYLTVDGDLEIRGTLNIDVKRGQVALNVTGKLKIVDDGSLTVNGGTVFTKKDLLVEDSGLLRLSGADAIVNGSVTVRDDASFALAEEAELEILGNMKLLNDAVMTMSESSMLTHGNLTFKSNSADTLLSSGTITVYGDATLNRGYIAESAEHRLEMLYEPKGWFGTKELSFKRDRGQMIGYLYIRNLKRCKANVESGDCFDSNLPFEIEGMPELSEKLLKQALTYDDRILSYYEITRLADMGGNMARELNEAEEKAIIMGFLQEIADGSYGVTVPTLTCRLVGLDGKKVYVAYADGKEIRQLGFTFAGGYGLSQGKLNQGFATIQYAGGNYLIGPSDPGRLEAVTKGMAMYMMRDAAEATLEDAVAAFRLNPNDALGKNGAIQYLKRAFKQAGIDLDEDTGYKTIAQLKNGLEAAFENKDEDYVKAMIELIRIAADSD